MCVQSSVGIGSMGVDYFYPEQAVEAFLGVWVGKTGDLLQLETHRRSLYEKVHPWSSGVADSTRSSSRSLTW